jgi:hypothetical protein
MSFDPSKLPSSVSAAYRMGPMAWPLVLEKAIQAGITDVNKLTDIVFYLHNPGRNGRPLTAAEAGPISQWKNFRSLIAPRLRGRSGQSGAASKSLDCETISFLDGRLL